MRGIVLKIFIALTVFTGETYFAQNTFMNTYGGPGNDYGEAIVCTNDYGYVIAGATESRGNGATDCYIIKIDSTGNFMWSKTFGGANIDWATDIVRDIDTNLVFCGYTNSYSSNYDISLTKLDSGGAFIWQNFYGGNDWDFAYSIAKTKDSSYLIAGETYSFGNGQNDGYLLKINSVGDTVWTKTFGGIKSDKFEDVIVCKNGNIFCCGKSNSYSTNGDSDFWLVYMDQNGNELWNVTLGDSLDDWANGAYQNSYQNIQIIGTKTNPADSIQNWWVYEIDTLGNYIWESANFQASQNNGVSLVGYPDQDDAYLNAMTTAYGNGGFDLYFSIIDYNGFLDLSRTTTYGRAGDEIINGADTTYAKTYVSVGTTYSTAIGYSSVAVFLLDSAFFIPEGTMNEYEDVTTVIELTENKLNLYPNPTTEYIRIESTSQVNSFSIYNLAGELVMSEQNQLNGLISVSELPQGIYFIKVNDQTLKFVKK